jgi:hypothetical protein
MASNDLSARLRANVLEVELFDEAAQTPNTVLDGAVFRNLHACSGFMTFYLLFRSGPLSVGQTLDVSVVIRPDHVTAVVWSSFIQLTNATAPPQDQLVVVNPNVLGAGHVNNAGFNSGAEAFYPFGDVFVRGTLSAGTGTPGYRVVLVGASMG